MEKPDFKLTLGILQTQLSKENEWLAKYKRWKKQAANLEVKNYAARSIKETQALISELKLAIKLIKSSQ